VKTPPVGAKLFDADGRTDMTTLIVAFRNFSNSRKTGLKTLSRAKELPSITKTSQLNLIYIYIYIYIYHSVLIAKM
jgi:hypothetical protein